MKLLSLAVLTVGLQFAALAGAAEPGGRPNIVFIVSDDQSWTDYGFMGHEQLHTPNLDRLAAASLAFRRGYVPSSVCCPSLASLLTGQYPHQNKITSNDPPLPAGAKSFNSDNVAAFQQGREVMNRYMDAAPTLPRLLADKRYLSLQTGKWWQGNYSHGGFTHGMTQGQRHGDAGLKIGRETMQPIFDFIHQAGREQRPFFVWYAPMMPHEPHNPPQRILDHYLDKTPSPHVARYWGMIEWFDETCGQLLDYLDKQGLADDTIVVFLADNGWIQDPSQPGYAARSKQSPYDGGLRTPLLIRWPGHVKPRVSDELASSIDIVPTLLAALGMPPRPDMQGINLLDAKAVAARHVIFGECFTHNAVDLGKPASSLRWRWVIDDNWKLMVPDSHNEPESRAELYDVVADPYEKTELVGEKPEVVNRLTRELDQWWKP